MGAVTIPRTLTKKGDLVVIPRKEYEKLLELKRIREFRPSAAQRKALAKAERNLRKGKTLSCDAFARALGAAH